jgi:hypothetical protein
MPIGKSACGYVFPSFKSVFVRRCFLRLSFFLNSCSFLFLKKSPKYRGVSKRSKNTWSTTYSNVRIKSTTCHTAQEAARLYDEYLRQHKPDKYLKVLSRLKSKPASISFFPAYQSHSPTLSFLLRTRTFVQTAMPTVLNWLANSVALQLNNRYGLSSLFLHP